MVLTLQFVRAIGEELFSSSNFSIDKTFIALPLVSNIRLVDGIVTWDQVPNANGYIIKINGKEQKEPLADNRYEGLTSGVSSSIFVRPVRDDETSVSFYSRYSNELTTTLIAAPTPSFNNQTTSIVWDAVSGAEGYNVRIFLNGQGLISETLGSSTTSFYYDFFSSR